MIVVQATRIEERGFIHKKIGKFASGLVQTGLGVVSTLGIPGISAGAGAVRSVLRGGSRDPAFQRAVGQQLGRGQAQRAQRFTGTGVAVTPFGVGAVAVQGGGAGGPAAMVAPGDQCPRGFHVNKSSYFLQSGEFVPAMSRCVRNRRRNNDNGRAAMRAARRLLGRKKSQDSIDKALRAFAPRGRGRTKPCGPRAGGTTVVAT